VTRELALILALLGTVSLLVKGCLMQSVEAATGRTIAVPTGGDFQAALTLPLQYPPNNFYPSSLDSVGFLNLAVEIIVLPVPARTSAPPPTAETSVSTSRRSQRPWRDPKKKKRRRR